MWTGVPPAKSSPPMMNDHPFELQVQQAAAIGDSKVSLGSCWGREKGLARKLTDGAVDDGKPAEGEEEHGAESSPLSEASHGKDGGDTGEHALVDHVQVGGKSRRTDRRSLIDVSESEVLEITDVGRSGLRKSERPTPEATNASKGGGGRSQRGTRQSRETVARATHNHWKLATAMTAIDIPSIERAFFLLNRPLFGRAKAKTQGQR